jgi:CxxC motif-containing protein (DUF1111 family)
VDGIGSVAGVPGLPPQCAQVSFSGEVVPAGAFSVGRRTPLLFGLGFVDAVPDATLIALAADEARRHPTTAGVVSRVIDPDTSQTAVGRFGWKAQEPTLHAFSGDAYLNEMGITNPSFPNENCPQGDCSQIACFPVADPEDNGTDVALFTSFMTLLDAPPRAPLDPSNKEGEQRFAKIGCADCHVADLQTGPSSVPALSRQLFHPYSDFLLHDMGALGDGIVQGAANERQMRTAPLWGLRVQTALLHDGRTSDVTEAIRAHDGQGAAARDAFFQLNATQRRKLLAFLASL